MHHDPVASETVAEGEVQGPPRRQKGPPENFLARYFKEMAELSVLRPEEEFEAARRIEELEVQLWAQLFRNPHLAEGVLAVVERGLENTLTECASVRRSARAMKGQGTAVQRKRYAAQCGQLAKRLHAVDVDRRLLFASLREFRKIARGEEDRAFAGKLRVNVQTETFKRHVREVSMLFHRSQRARNDFVKANLRLVVSIARRFNHGRMPLSDLIQEGNIGLIKAVERYDYRRGYRFSTYASWWIRHSISRALADKGRAVRLPVHMIDAHHKVAKARRELSSQLGRPPTKDEIGKTTGLSTDKVDKLEGYLMEQAVSLDREVSDEDGRRFIDFIQDPEASSPSDQLMDQSENTQVLELFDELKPIEADILRKRFGLAGGKELTLKEIGETYNLSRERIRQLQEQALGKIRRALQRQQPA
ncbi:MAG: sigma-70 family RNA polymerase sigma factor [Deltaproteobacteria bacterium]|nr:sigma-70 family RNA polymerase sigma factor [Deltaproteobacteria bacterium]